MSRTAAAILAAMLAGAVLGACGGGSSTPTSTRASAASPGSSTANTSTPTPGATPSLPRTSTATPGQPSKGGEAPPGSGQGPPARGPLTQSQAVAFANAVNLQPADVRGFTIASPEQQQSPEESRLERAMLGCVGIMNGHAELAEVDSKEFERKAAHGVGLGVSSSISVARTPALAALGLTAVHDPLERGCLTHYLSQNVEGSANGEAKILSLSSTPEKALARGADGGVKLRIDATVVLARKPTPLALDFYGFVCGQTQIGLFTTSLSGAFPSKTRRQLLALLLARAKAHGQCLAAHPAGA